MTLAGRIRRALRIRSAPAPDTVPVMHPRPTRDPRIVCTYVSMLYVCAVQSLFGPSPDSVNGQAFSAPHVNFWYLTLLAISSAFILASAFPRSEYLAVALELIGSIGSAFVCVIFTTAAAATITDAYSTQGTGWAVGFALGSAIRVGQLFRKIW